MSSAATKGAVFRAKNNKESRRKYESIKCNMSINSLRHRMAGTYWPSSGHSIENANRAKHASASAQTWQKIIAGHTFC
jgi:hypothetical protein